MGKWELYENDGTLSGYYRPFYDEQQISNHLMDYKPPEGPRVVELLSIDIDRRDSSTSKSRINEFQGIILKVQIH